MNRDEHVAIADSEGYFYCRAVDGRLNYRKEQQVCGRGCPCYTEGTLCVPGQFVCCYQEKDWRKNQPFFRLWREWTSGCTRHIHTLPKVHMQGRIEKDGHSILCPYYYDHELCDRAHGGYAGATGGNSP